MERFFKFAVIRGVPDARRGERVNVGLVIEGPDGLDVRLPETRKLRTLTGHRWELVADAYAAQMKVAWAHRRDFSRLSEDPASTSEVFTLGASGTMRVYDDDYEERIRSILKALVDRPILSRSEKQDRINTEISKVLKTASVLGQKDDNINTGRVIPKFVVSEEKAVVADFAHRGMNKLKIVSTLDLRGTKAAHAKACEKGAVLYFAQQRFGEEMTPIGVYAVTKTEREARQSEIEVLSGFAGGNVYNWLDARERQRFQSALY